jgi:hypothetical protein
MSSNNQDNTKEDPYPIYIKGAIVVAVVVSYYILHCFFQTTWQVGGTYRFIRAENRVTPSEQGLMLFNSMRNRMVRILFYCGY